MAWALRELAPEMVEISDVGVGLCAFGEDGHADIVREANDRAQHGRPCALGVGAHERSIDLDGVEREAWQVHQR